MVLTLQTNSGLGLLLSNKHHERMPLFYYLLDTAICNAYILSKHYYKSRLAYNTEEHIRSTHRAFRGALIDDLIIQYKITPVRIYRNPQCLLIRRLDRPYNLH